MTTTKIMEIQVRKSVENLEAYIPGKPIAELQREVPALKGKKIIKLASNENPLGPSPRAVAAMRKALTETHRYPESTSPVLREALAKLHGVKPDQIIVGCGADEILRLVVESVLEHGDKCVISQYAFSRFRQHIRLMGAQAAEVPMKNYTHDLAAMALRARAIGAKIVFIANPNNPTSTFNSAHEIQELFDILGPSGPLVVLDEAYADFARDAYPDQYMQSIPQAFRLYPRLIVLRTLSKVMGLAGVRVGYGVSNAKFIESMNRARLIFNVNTLGQIAAVESLKDTGHIKRTLEAAKKGRLQLSEGLWDLGFEVINGASNFIFARVPRGTGAELYRKLLDHGVIIRPLSDPGLESHVRISIGTPAENKILLKALTSVYS